MLQITQRMRPGGGLCDVWPDMSCHLVAPFSISHLPSLLYGPHPWHDAVWVCFLGKTIGIQFVLNDPPAFLSESVVGLWFSFPESFPTSLGMSPQFLVIFLWGTLVPPWKLFYRETARLGVLSCGQAEPMRVGQIRSDGGDHPLVPTACICGTSLVPVLFKARLFSLSFDVTISASNKLVFFWSKSDCYCCLRSKNPEKAVPCSLFSVLF